MGLGHPGQGIYPPWWEDGRKVADKAQGKGALLRNMGNRVTGEYCFIAAPYTYIYTLSRLLKCVQGISGARRRRKRGPTLKT